jgi:hypothetical protein
MSTIGTAASYAGDIFNLLSGNSSGTSSAADPWKPTSPLPAILAANGGAPATRVDLSDKVKDILARASSDQDVSDRLRAFVESRRVAGRDDDGHSYGHGYGHGFNVDVSKAFERLPGQAAVSDDSQDDASQVQNFASSLSVDGYSITAWGPGLDGITRIAIHNPDGSSFYQRSSGTDAAFSGLSAGAAVQAYQRDNKEYITFSESEAAATSVTASSEAGLVSATSAATHTASVTFVVDFDTGGLSIVRSDSTSVSTTVQINRPGSAYSALA